ncbi:cytidylate kinase-like family protein [Clostridium sp. KNHs205]|jgi:cytidylate kinase|uniref:cytidylate kinase-like family protein n=1 Tax=Clostridium sp. KNHs205 TaxID=1449050 RepID=UPI00051C4FCE|nr:cytidylate kinase-like family protein [Clostridium sp. KNHs205]
MKNYVITIARGYGSGGRTMGKMLAEELGIHYYDRELMRLASDESGINEELFGRADEQLKQSLLYRIARREYKGELIQPDREDFVSNDNLFSYQAKVIKRLAEEESCVIVGRCADYILKDMDNVVKVFIHASLEDCVTRLEGMFSLPAKELEKKIIETDKRRAAYYRYYTGRDWEAAKNYDLCLNSKQLGFDKCVKIVRDYLDIRFN